MLINFSIILEYRILKKSNILGWSKIKSDRKGRGTLSIRFYFLVSLYNDKLHEVRGQPVMVV